MKIVTMNLFSDAASGNTLAFFDVQTDENIIIKGFRIVKGMNGLFISPPDKKSKNGNYVDEVTLPKEIKEKLEKMAIEELKRKQKQFSD